MAEESIFSGDLSALKKALGGTATTAIGLGGALLTGKQQLSDYSGALRKNTDALGGAFSAVGKVVDGLAKFADESLQEYQALTTVGATFNKEIKDIKVAAAELGMTVEDMTSFLQNNATALRAFGGTTDQAIARFKALNTTVLDAKELGIELRRLGFTTKDISEGLALFGEITESNGRNESMTLQQQAQSAKDLMVELDGLAKLTGKNRKELADEMRAKRRQGDVNAFLMGKSAEEQQAFMNQLVTMQETLGQDAADAFVDIALRGAPTTEGARNAMLAMGDGADQLYTAAAQFNSGDIGAFTQSMIDARGAAIDFQDTEEFRNAAILGSVSTVSAGFAEASKAAFDFKKGLDAEGEEGRSAAATEREIRKSIAQEQERQMKQVTGIFDKTIDIQDNLRQITSATMDATIGKIEDVAIAGLEKFQTALPSKDEIIAGISKGVDSLFDIAEISDRQDGGFNRNHEDLGSILESIQQTDANITDSTDANTEAVKEGAKNTATEIQSSETRVLSAQEQLKKAQDDIARLTSQGFTAMDPPMQAAKEAAERAASAVERLAQAQEFTMSKIDQFNRARAGMGNFSGGFAEGGNIPAGGFGMVGEAGPEFVTGPANIMSAKSSMGVMQTLMKSIRALDTNVQDVQSNIENGISTSNESSTINLESNKKLDTMIGLLGQLIQVENMAVGTQSRQLRATKGLTGNMLRGV